MSVLIKQTYKHYKTPPWKGQHVLPFLIEAAAGTIIISQQVIIISQTTLRCWICCACLVLCNQYISMHTKGKHTKYNWLVWVNLLGWLVWMLYYAACAAVIDNINEKINIACNTQLMNCAVTTWIYSCYSHYVSISTTVWRIYPLGRKYLLELNYSGMMATN